MKKRYAALTLIALALVAAGAAHAQTIVINNGNPIDLFAQAGGSPVSVNVTFTSSDNGATSIPFSVVPGSSWITVSSAPSGGFKTPATVSVTVTPTGLSAGQNIGTLQVFSAQFQTVQVIATVSSISVMLPNNQTSIWQGVTYQAGSTVYPAPQTLTVIGANGNFTVSKGPADNWYTAAAYGSPLSAVLVSFNQEAASTLTPSATPLTGTLTITPGGNNAVPVTVPITLTVTASPQVTVNPASLVFNWQQGGTNNQSQLLLTLTSNAPQAINFAVSGMGFNWITLPSANPTSIPANGSAQVAIQVNGNTQPQGLSNGSVQFTINGALFPNGTTTLTIPVQLNVSTLPVLYAPNSALTYSYTFGSLQLPQPQVVTPTSSGGSTQPLTYNVSTPPGDNWIGATPPGTISTAGGSFSVTANVAGLSPGTYKSTVTITPVANGSGQAPLTIPVTLTISFQSMLQVSTQSLIFPYEVGQAAPASQVVSISSSTGSPLSYNVSAPTASIAPWLSVTGCMSQCITDQTSFTVSINPTGVPTPTPASYLDATISVAASDPVTGSAINTVNIDVRLYASNTPQLIVSPPGTLQFATYPNSPSYPLSNTATLSLSSSDPTANGILSITSVTRTATNSASTGNWLGGTAPGTQSATSFTVNGTAFPATMPTGSYSGSVAIAATGPNGIAVSDSPITIPAIFTIDSARGSIVTPRTDGSILFQQVKGSAAPAAQVVNVATDGLSLPFTAVANTGVATWLTVGAPTGPAPGSFRVSADASNLTTGTYTGAIYVTMPNAYGSPFRIPVTFQVQGGTIASSASSLTFSQILGGAAPAAQTIQITSTPSSVGYATSVNVTTPANGTWLAANAGSGNTPGTVTVTVTPGSLLAGTYNGSVTVTSAGTSGSPITIPVTLTIQQATLSAPTTGLTFNQLAGGPAPAAQSVAVTSTPGPIPFTVSTASSTCTSAAWLSATAGTSGTTGTTPGTVQISVNSGSLSPGPCSGTVTITSAGATGSPITIPVLLNVGTAVVLSVSQTSLTFSAVIGQATQPQTVQLTATGSTPFTVTSTTKDGASWLTAAPSSGTAGGGAITLTVSANTQNLTAGSYSGTVTIASSTSLTPVTINVALTVTAIPTPVLVAVKNAASYVAGAVSPGENIVIGGTGIGPATLAGAVLTASGQFSTLVGQTQVLFDGTPAPIIYASATQTSVMVPYEIAGRSVTNIMVVYSGVQSVALPYNVVSAVPGIYCQNLQGFGPGVIQNSDNVTVNGPNTPAAKGSEVVIYMTGEGVTTAAGTTGAVAGTTGNPLNKPVQTVTATVAGLPATVVYAGSAPGEIYGVMQVNINIPANAPSGAQPLVINVGNNATQVGVTVAVQ